jgi:plastocyanin
MLLGAWLTSVAWSAPQVSQAPATHTITIENMRFNPEALSVRRGDRIVWINKDLFPHTATAKAKEFDSGSIAAEGSWVFVTNEPGEYAYVCTFHPTMAGMITVR